VITRETTELLRVDYDDFHLVLKVFSSLFCRIASCNDVLKTNKTQRWLLQLNITNATRIHTSENKKSSLNF
jgi:hypothetical protein